MAYGLKYQSDFYNYFGKLVSVKLYRDGFSGSVTNIRTQKVTLDWNYQGMETPVAGTGVKITIVNETDVFNYFEDLLTAYEKKYKCVIEYDETIVFEGFNICDLAEQQILLYSTVTVQFTNYLRRLENSYLDINISDTSLMIEKIQEGLDSTELYYPLYVNSTLFEDNTPDEDSVGVYTWLSHTYFDASILYMSLTDYSNIYDSLNKLLKPFSAYVYSYEQKWIIERYEDIGRTGDWIKYRDLTSTAGSPDAETTANLKQEYNKQNGDFQYIDTSQILAYDSGMQKLIMNLKDQLLATLVFNNFTTDMLTTYAFALSTSSNMLPRTWYIHEDCVNLAVGYNMRDISWYFKWEVQDTWEDYQWMGIHYNFPLTLNDIFGDKPTELSISYKMTTYATFSAMELIRLRFYVRLDGGAYADYFIKFEDDGTTSLTVDLTVNEIEFVESADNLISTFEASRTFDLADLMEATPVTQNIIIGFLPMYYKRNSGETGYFEQNYIGDIVVKIDPNDVDNEITTELNENFLKTEELDVDLFDLDNWNFSNGLSYELGTIKTSSWHSEKMPISYPAKTLVDNFIFNRFHRLSKTLRTLKATILCDAHIKPFSIIIDEDLQSEDSDVDSSGSILKFIMHNYTWDLMNGTYDIEAEEYPETEINIIEE